MRYKKAKPHAGVQMRGVVPKDKNENHIIRSAVCCFKRKPTREAVVRGLTLPCHWSDFGAGHR